MGIKITKQGLIKATGAIGDSPLSQSLNSNSYINKTGFIENNEIENVKFYKIKSYIEAKQFYEL